MSATNQRYLRSILPKTDEYELGTSLRMQIDDLKRA
jgi:hypothetical protein